MPINFVNFVPALPPPGFVPNFAAGQPFAAAHQVVLPPVGQVGILTPINKLIAAIAVLALLKAHSYITTRKLYDTIFSSCFSGERKWQDVVNNPDLLKCALKTGDIDARGLFKDHNSLLDPDAYQYPLVALIKKKENQTNSNTVVASLKTLLDHGANKDINAQHPRFKRTALSLLLQTSEEYSYPEKIKDEMAHMMIEHGADISNGDKLNLLRYPKSLKIAIEMGKFDVNSKDGLQNGFTPLQAVTHYEWFSEIGNEIAQILIDHGAEIAGNDLTNLMNFPKVFENAIKTGKYNVNCLLPDGQKPLEYVLNRKIDVSRELIAKLLIENGADIPKYLKVKVFNSEVLIEAAIKAGKLGLIC